MPVPTGPVLCPTCLGLRPGGGGPCLTCAGPQGGPSRVGAAALLGLAVVMGGCGDKEAVALYGVEITDEDDDGWGVEEGDCDDSDDSIHPEATETPGDGVDSNCDGDDDT